MNAVSMSKEVTSTLSINVRNVIPISELNRMETYGIQIKELTREADKWSESAEEACRDGREDYVQYCLAQEVISRYRAKQIQKIEDSIMQEYEEIINVKGYEAALAECERTDYAEGNL